MLARSDTRRGAFEWLQHFSSCDRRLEDVFVRLLITCVTSSSFRVGAGFGAKLGYGQIVFRPEASLKPKGPLSLGNQRCDDDKCYQ